MRSALSAPRGLTTWGRQQGGSQQKTQRTQPPGVSVLPEKECKVDKSIPEQLEWDCLEPESVYEGVPRSDNACGAAHITLAWCVKAE